jgi:hypothetical protein
MQTPDSPTDAIADASCSPVGGHTPFMLPQTDTPATFHVHTDTRCCRDLNVSNRMVLRVLVLHGCAKPFVGYRHDRCSVAGAALGR